MNLIFYFLLFLSMLELQQNVIEIIDAEKLNELSNDNIIIYDIRTPSEYKAGRIPNAKHIDFFSSDFNDYFKKLDKRKPLMVYCAVGGRSERAAQILKDLGFEKIYDYAGGYYDWTSKGGPIEK